MLARIWNWDTDVLGREIGKIKIHLGDQVQNGRATFVRVPEPGLIEQLREAGQARSLPSAYAFATLLTTERVLDVDVEQVNWESSIESREIMSCGV